MRPPIHLLQITHDLDIGGLQQVVVTLCRTIDRDRFHITVLCLRALGPLTKEIEKLGIKVILLPQKPGTDYFSFLKVAKVLKEEQIQVIHTHNTQPLIDGTIGAIISGKRQRIIHTDHGRQFPDKFKYMFAEWCMSHFVYKIIGVSEKTTADIRKYEKISQEKLTTIINGIDGTRFSLNTDIQGTRKKLGILFGDLVLGVISRVEKVKGITFLLQALPKIVEQFPKLTLLIVGSGSETENLRREADQLGLSKNVIFTGARNDISEILQILDIYILPSLSEGLPMGLLEAMAAGCPIVASDVGGIPTAVTHNETAILVPPGNVQKLTEAIIMLCESNILREEMSSNLRRKFSGSFDSTLMANSYSELYSGR